MGLGGRKGQRERDGMMMVFKFFASDVENGVGAKCRNCPFYLS